MHSKKLELYINGEAYSLDHISEYLKAPSLPSYAFEIISFIEQWRSGQQDFFFQTSGSTGVPKTIKAPRALLEYSASNTLAYLDVKPRDKALICLNTQFVAGKMMLIRSLYWGLSMYIVEPRLDPFKVYNGDFDFAAVVPLQLEKWLQLPSGVESIQKIKKIIVGGAALSTSLKMKCQTLNCAVYETYGMTETYSHIALKNIKTDDAFTVVYDDLLLAVDERSCLKIKGAITAHEWIQTNDIVVFRGTKNFEFIGRADFIINSGGLKINPIEIEDAIGLHYTNLGNFVVSSIPHEHLGEVLVLVIESTQVPSLSFDFLDKYKQPKQIISLPKFPYTNSGKIDRNQIKKIIFTAL